VQIPGLAYSIIDSGYTLAFDEAPTSTDVIDVRTLTTTSTITELASQNGYNQVIATNTGVEIWLGVSSSVKTWNFDATTGALLPVGLQDIGSLAAPIDDLYASNVHITGGSLSGVSITLNALNNTPVGNAVPSTGAFTTLSAASTLAVTNGSAITSNETGTAFGTSPTVIDSFAAATYRTAKYVVQVTNGSTYQAAEVLLTHDSANAYPVSYAVVSSTGSTFATFTANVTGGNVELYATGTGAGNTAKLFRTYIAV
jgi:hypothetical protein